MIETGNGPRAGRSNLKGLPILQAAGDGEARTADLEFGGKRYHAGVAYSDALHWHFVTTTPAGLDNPRVLSTVLIVIGAFGVAILVSIFLSPTWAQQLAAPLDRIVAQARETAQGGNGRWPRGRIAELNALSADLESMAGALRELNVELEHRVEKRTQALAESNESLSNTLARLEQAQHELVRAEKMAALGGLVAGVAHELNTPIGNGLMAVSTLSDQAREFRRIMQGGLRRSDLEHLLGSVEQATDIAARNLSRAADLVTSFKQVAVDQASSQRRRFELAEVVGEIAVTLGPSLKRTPYVLTTDVPAGLALDSYPGPLGQTLANLINNALLHAFDGRDAGHVHIAARLADDGMIEVDVTDDGKGIPAALIGRIFDPFVTTRMGRGGTGLGLHIAYNAVTHVLGGSLQVDSAEGQGACFRLRLPAVAPAAVTGDIHEV
jgi:signal transduction histidine kinase